MPGQYLFGVAPMTLAAVTTTFAFSAIYHSVTGSYFFVDSHIPIAVFLGMTLLFTDPATSPRTLVGRILYGVLYGLTTVLAVRLAARARTRRVSTTSCSKCRCSTCPSSCSTGWRGRRRLKALDPSAWAREWAPRRRHLAYMGVYASAFAAHERVRASRRRASRAMDAVLGAGVRGRQARCLPEPVLPARRLLRGRLRVVVQRDRHPAGRALRQSRASPRRRSTARARCNSPPAATTPLPSRATRTLRHDDPTAADYRFILRGSKGPIGDREPRSSTRAPASWGGRAPAAVVDRPTRATVVPGSIAHTTGLRTSAPYASCPGAT